MPLMRRWMAAVLLCLTCVGSVARAQTIPDAYVSKTRVTTGNFGTASRLCVFDDFSDASASARFETAWAGVKEILARVERLASVSMPDSDIARFNALGYGESVDVDAETVRLIELAREMCARTDGYFDPTVYPLVDLWGFSPRFTGGDDARMSYDRARAEGTLPPPDEKYLDAFLSLVGMDGVAVLGDEESGYSLRKDTPTVYVDGVGYEAQLDLGGIAKGYACDLVAEMLAQLGYQYGYFSSGSSSMRLLKNASASAKQAADDHYYLAVRKPRETDVYGSAFAEVRTRDQALSSSGDYGITYTLNGDVYCHIIDPFTGYPLGVPSGGVQSGVCAVTLLSGNAAMDDAYSTALCLMGPKRAIKYVNEHLQDQSVILVLYRADKDTYEVVTNLKDDEWTITDHHYVKASERTDKGEIIYTGTLFDLK